MKRGVTLIELLVGLCIIAVVATLFFAAFSAIKNQKKPADGKPYWLDATTIEHEGHQLFVVFNKVDRIPSAIHSPNCPCHQKKQPVKAEVESDGF